MNMLKDKAEEYSTWESRLISILRQSRPQAENRPLHLGILGALGCGDVGDEAMLVAMTERLQRLLGEVEWTIFSNRPEVTNKYLHCNALPTLHRVLMNRKNLASVAVYLTERAEENLAKVLCRLMGSRCKRSMSHGRIARFMYLRAYRRMKMAAMELASRQRPRAPQAVVEHIADIQKLDALLLLGGGYLNSWHVGSRMFSYLFSIGIAKSLGKTVVGSGLNLGPFSKRDRELTAPFFRQFDLIGLRDWDESVSELEAMGLTDPNVLGYSFDDAGTLAPDALGDDELTTLTGMEEPYILVQLHRWRDSKDFEKVSDSIAAALDKLMTKHSVRVVMVSFTFGMDGNGDRRCLASLRDKTRHPGRITMIERDLHPKQIKYLCANAKVAICTRHHPLVFCISSGVPVCAISYDRYYTMKFRGVARVLSHLARILDMKSVGSESITEAVEYYLGLSHEKCS